MVSAESVHILEHWDGLFSSRSTSPEAPVCPRGALGTAAPFGTSPRDLSRPAHPAAGPVQTYTDFGTTKRNNPGGNLPRTRYIFAWLTENLTHRTGLHAPDRGQRGASGGRVDDGEALADSQATASPWRPRGAVDPDVPDGTVAQFFRQALQQLGGHEADLGCPGWGVGGDR